MNYFSSRGRVSERRRSLSSCFGTEDPPRKYRREKSGSAPEAKAGAVGKPVRLAKFDPPAVPASMFGIVLGLGGLANAWRAAAKVWGFPSPVGEAIFGLASIVWLSVSALYVIKWIYRPDMAIAELKHPVRCCFVGLAAVAPMLIAQGLLPYMRPAAIVLFLASAAATIAFAVWRTGALWTGGRAAETVTPVLYLPVVAGGFVMAGTAAASGLHALGLAAYGAAMLSWLALESVLLNRLFKVEPLDPELRPTLGFLIAPPTVGSVAMLALEPHLQIVVYMLLGYASLQGMILLRMLPWIGRNGFTPGYWAFTFGATAFATALLKLAGASSDTAAQILAAAAFFGANLIVGIVALRSLVLLVRYVAGRMSGPNSPQGPSLEH